MSFSSDIQLSLRRLKPDKHRAQLRSRAPADLPFLRQARKPFPKLLLDSTVYIDELQGRLPQEVELYLRVCSVWHSTVTEAELAALAGLLNPAHVETANVVKQVMATLEQRPKHRILNPDREVWREAGILGGLLARLQQYGKAEQRRALNDALIFLSAAKHGCSVLTRNVADFDLLQQLVPDGQVLFYERKG